MKEQLIECHIHGSEIRKKAACGKEIERLNGETQTAAAAHAEALERIDGEFDAAMK